MIEQIVLEEAGRVLEHPSKALSNVTRKVDLHDIEDIAQANCSHMICDTNDCNQKIGSHLELLRDKLHTP